MFRQWCASLLENMEEIRIKLAKQSTANALRIGDVKMQTCVGGKKKIT